MRRDRDPQLPIITMAGYTDIDLLRASIKLGTHEYFVTPTHKDVLKVKCAKAFLHQKSSDSF